MKQQRVQRRMPGRWLVLCLAPALVLLPAAQAARLGGAAAPVLVVDQSVASDALGQVRQSRVQAMLHPVASTASGLGLDWAPALDRSVDAGALALTPLSWRDPPLPTAALGGGGPGADPWRPAETAQLRLSRLSALASQSTSAQAPGLAARLAAALAAAGAGDAWFNYRHALPVAGRTRVLSWSLHVAASGTWFAGTPAVDAPGTAVLHASYVTRTAAAGLPSAIGYRDAGWLRWTLSDPQGHPLAGAGERDAGGAFDGDAGVACLLGLRMAARCQPGQEGVPALMERLGANQAEVVVISALQPVYASGAAGQRYAVAGLAVTRTLQGGGQACLLPPWRYTNAWRAAFVLDAVRTRYHLPAAGVWQVLARDHARWTTPLTDWKTLSLPLASSDLAALSDAVIDPDRGLLVSLAAFPAGVQDVQASAVACRPGAVAGLP